MQLHSLVIRCQDHLSLYRERFIMAVYMSKAIILIILCPFITSLRTEYLKSTLYSHQEEPAFKNLL